MALVITDMECRRPMSVGVAARLSSFLLTAH